MKVGVAREIKNNEYRVALTPAGAQALTSEGHEVYVEAAAGDGSGFPDADYTEQGARVVSREALFEQAELILKVKEPLPAEYHLFREGQILFTYLHLAPNRELTQALIDSGVTAVAYETVQGGDGSLPLLTPMSEVAGRMAPQIGAHFLEAPHGGRGVLLSGVPGVPPADVIIIGGGIVGTNAAKVALGLGASVTVLDIDAEQLRYLDDIFQGRVTTLMSNPLNIAAGAERADILIGAVLVTGARAPRLVTEDMVMSMKDGAVVVDVAIDQGGSIATSDQVTTHDNPTYRRHGVIHYAVANIPGSVPRTSTLALTNATLPYVRRLANDGVEAALAADPALRCGVNVAYGAVTHEAVSRAHGLDYTPAAAVFDLPEA